MSYTQHDEQFPVFAVIAMLLLLALLLLLERKNPWLKRYNFFTKDKENPSILTRKDETQENQ